MNLGDNIFVGDIETDGLLNEMTKLHVFVLGFKTKEGSWATKATNREEDIRKIFTNPSNTIVMHNGRRFDGPAIEKLYGFKVQATIIDSLALAWYLEPNRVKEGKKYGLESYGEEFGVPKPEIKDWNTLTYEEYAHRATEDVKINIRLWMKQLRKLNAIYDGDEASIKRLISLLNWIMDCSFQQEVNGVMVDVAKTEANLAHFEAMKEEKIIQLKAAMPKIPKIAIKSFPKRGLYKADGSLSKAGEEWLTMLDKLNLPSDYQGDIKIVKDYEEPNPNSVPQKKQWLYSLGWKPETFKHNRDKVTNEVDVVEQIMTEDKMLCPSVLKLIEKEPAIEALDGLTVLTHRIGLLKSFLKNKDDNGYVHQGLQSLAVTMRWMHSIIVNLPRYTGTGDIRDGKWIRECLIAGPGKKIVQSDLSGIESRTSDHYTFHIDPARIEKTKQKYYDPHTEIAVFANLMTADEEIWFKWYKERKESDNPESITPELFGNPSPDFEKLRNLDDAEAKKLMTKLKIARSAGKTTNYASLYNVGPSTLARNLEISESKAKTLLEAYWKINFSIKVFTESLEVKKVDKENWIYNPISKFWYYLRNEKDKFSVINQSSAVYCFNIWVYNCTKAGIWPVTQSHDDQLYIVDENKADETVAIINNAMEKVNEQIRLNVRLDCETQTGSNVAETH